MSASSPEQLRRWELYLSRLEAWAGQVGDPAAISQDPSAETEEAALAPAPEPVLDGPLPAELADRARQVLEALGQANARAQAARVDVGRQLSALRQVPPLDGGEARYLDTSG